MVFSRQMSDEPPVGRRTLGLRRFLIAGQSPDVVQMPEAETAAEGGEVIAQPRSGRNVANLLGIAAAQNDVIRLKSHQERGDDALQGAPPGALADPPHAGAAEHLPKLPAVAVEQVPQL